MSSTLKRNVVLAIVLFIVYLSQNILRNIFVNVFSINEIVATLITVVAFGSLSLLLVKKDNYFKVKCTSNKCITYIIVVILILSIINLFPFDLSIEITTVSVFITMFFVGLMEELIFRGCIYKICDERWGEQKAVIFSSVLFGFIHIINILQDDIVMVLLQLVYAACIGIIFAVVIYKKQGIILCILAHAIINIAGNLGATETIYKEIVFTIICVVLAFIMISKFDLLKRK